MMKTLQFFLLTVLGIYFFSCEDKEDIPVLPTASFEAFQMDRTTYPKITTGQEVKFVNNSLDGLNYYWDFGDGRRSTDPEPIISYDTSGQYDITLTVESETGDISTETKRLDIYELVLDRMEFVAPWYWSQHLQDLNWTTDGVTDVVIELCVGNYDPYDLSFEEVIFSSDTLKDVMYVEGEYYLHSSYSNQDIVFHYNQIATEINSQSAYKVLIYLVRNDERKLYYRDPGILWHTLNREQFGISIDQIEIYCDYVLRD